MERAAAIALTAAREALEEAGTPLREVRFALFSDSDLEVFAAALATTAQR